MKKISKNSKYGVFISDAKLTIIFGPQFLPRGSLVIVLVRPSVGLWSVFKYLRDRSLVFSNFLHEVRAP